MRKKKKKITKNAVVQIIDISPCPTHIEEDENGNRQQYCIHLITKRQKNPVIYICFRKISAATSYMQSVWTANTLNHFVATVFKATFPYCSIVKTVTPNLY